MDNLTALTKKFEAEFRAELKALLKKYDAELEADDHWIGYAECGEDIRITAQIDGIWEYGKVIRPRFSIDFGNLIDGKD